MDGAAAGVAAAAAPVVVAAGGEELWAAAAGETPPKDRSRGCCCAPCPPCTTLGFQPTTDASCSGHAALMLAPTGAVLRDQSSSRSAGILLMKAQGMSGI